MSILSPVLHIDLGHEWRGGQSQALLLIRGLLARGHDAELVVRSESPLAARAKDAGVVVHTPGVLRKLLRSGRFKLVHCHDARGLTSAWLAGASRHSKLVAARRVAYPLSRIPLARARYRAARIIAISEFVKRSVVESGIPEAQIDVVYDGVEIPPPSPPRSGSRVLGSVGYLLPEKGHELLIRVLPLILGRHPDCRLLLAGDGPCRAALERLAEEYSVTRAVEFAGFVENVDAVYRALDVFLLPSLAEPLGSALLSAMAYGLPAVGLATGAAPEVIENGRNGLLAPARDAGAYADAVLSLLDDPAQAARLGAAARETIEKGFSADAMIDGTLQVYHRVLAC